MSKSFDHVALENQSGAPVRVTADPTARLPIPRTLLLWLTFGVAGAALFTIVYLIEGVTRPDYSAWRLPISALSLGPGGWVQRANFVVFGVCTLCLADAWRKVLVGSLYGIVYPIIRVIEGLALIMVAFFSQDSANGYPPGTAPTALTVAGQIHIIGAYVIVGAMAGGLFTMAVRFFSEPQWRGWAVYSALSGLLTLVFMAFFGAAQNPHGALAAYAGLFERLATNMETIWGVLLLACLWAGVGFMRPHP